MPWFFPWSDFIKKRACRYLLQHYLGHFLQEKLTLDQLTVDLYNGTGRVENVPLDVWSVNEMLDSVGVPFEIIDGFISGISVSVPWTALLNDSCCLDIEGLELTISPRQRVDPSTLGSMTDSMIWNAMTTSMELAQECLKQGSSTGEEQAEASQPFEGLESFAQTIESVLARVKLSFTDSVIRFEHLPKDSQSGIGLEIHIKRIVYSDLSTELAERDSHYKAKSVYEPAACACKNLKIFGISVHLDEFPEQSRTMPQNSDSPYSPPPSPGSHSCSPPLPHSHSPFEGQSLSAEHFTTPPLPGNLFPPIKIAAFAGHSEVKLKLKQNIAVPGPKVDVECFLGTLNVFLSPKQVHLLLDVSSAFTSPDVASQPPVKGHSFNKPMEPEDYQRIEQDLQNQLVSKRQHDHRQQEGQQRVDSWNVNFNSYGASDRGSYHSSGTDYDSILGEEGEDTFYSMTSNNDVLPPLEEPVLPADMLSVAKMTSGNLLLAQEFSAFGAVGGCDKRFTSQRVQIPGQSLTEAANSVFVSAQQSTSPVTDLRPGLQPSSAPRRRSGTNPGLAGIAALDDPCPDVVKVAIKLTSLAVTVLHVDPVLSPQTEGEGSHSDSASSHPLSRMADKFFSSLGTYGFGGKDFEDMAGKFAAACAADHLRCMAAPISFEFERTVSSSHQTGNSELSAGKLELTECLFERSSSFAAASSPYSTTQLLKFSSSESIAKPYFGASMSSSLPCLRLKYRSTQRTTSPGGVQSRNVVVPKTELWLELGSLLSEVDVSIIDRLTALLDPQPVFMNQASTTQSRMHRSCNPSTVNQQAVFTQAMEDAPTTEQPFNIHISCPSLTVILRFPIPDLRAAVDRRPWWKQSLRKERLVFDFSAVEFSTSLCGSEHPNHYDLSFRELQGHFQEDTDSTSLPVLHVTHGQSDSDSGNGGFDWPRIVVTVQPPAPLSALEEVPSSDNSPLSSLDAYPVMKAEPSPFSSRPVMFETEELLLPGNQEEMNKFTEDAVASSKVHVECTFPRLDVNLHTKETFENLYNRLASDLLLWEPVAPCPADRPDPGGYSIGAGLDLASQLLQAQGPDRFVMCRSGVHSYDDDGSSSDEEGSSNLTSLGNKYKRTASNANGQTMLAFSLNVTKARLAMFPVSEMSSPSGRSKDELSLSPEEQEEVLGEISAEFCDVGFFLAASYKGQDDLSYLCLQSRKVSVQHAPLVLRDAHRSMESAFSGAELQSTLYQTEPGLAHGLGKTGEAMFAFAIKVSSDTGKNMKEILFSLGLRRITLRHRMLSSKQMWLTQLMDFVDVKDDPILGFNPPAVVTVFHTHVWEGTIDYRPIHLPLRVLVTIETFNVSSNITIESNVSLLRFIIDDAAFYLSDKCSGSADIRNYVCVLDLGMFELSLYTSDGNEQGHPQVELRMSNNTVHIRTCADSCSALLQLIQYIAADGDLVPSYEPEEPDDTKTPSTPSRCPAEPPVKQGPIDEGELSSIMTEAMVDTPSLEEPSHDKSFKGELNHQLSRSPRRDLFLFPDDELASPDEDHFPPEDVALEVGEQGGEEQDEDSDDDFCILEHPDKEPEGLSHEFIIKRLTEEPISVVENHFSVPIGPSDQLIAPSHFPPAVFRYTLREMSVVWLLYGGRDFGGVQSRDPNKRISFALDEKGRPIDSSAIRANASLLNKKSATKKYSRTDGGPDRNTDVLMEFYFNKIRLQYEEYPEDTEQASRLVVLVQDVEIRDRLAHSQINKFLYQYTSEACPKQSHANMILLKMLHIRPDPDLTAQECNLRVSIQPLRLNVDQDALFFLRDFFSEVMGEAAKNPKGSNTVSSSPVKSVPVLSSSPDWLTDFSDIEEPPSMASSCGAETDSSHQAPTFFRSFIFSPEVPIRLDYQGKRVDMEQGTFTGLLIGLGQLNCSELRLKRLCCRSGLLGFDKVLSYALSEWLTDIRSTQLPGILGGVGPVHSFLQLFQGLVDLVWLPIDQYRRDGRVMRGLQRGANSFTTSSAMAFLELTNRVVQMVQAAAETAYDVVSPGSIDSPIKRGQHRLAQQPADLREGVSNAYQVVKDGIGQTATNIVQVAKEEHEQKGVTGALGGVLRQVPATVVQPFILATEATSNVLGGVRNQILPDARREAAEKWRASP